jgi:hypothetical protein
MSQRVLLLSVQVVLMDGNQTFQESGVDINFLGNVSVLLTDKSFLKKE